MGLRGEVVKIAWWDCVVDQRESVVDGLVECGMGWWGSLYMAWNVLECHDVVITW